jgi:hypothetical protein
MASCKKVLGGKGYCVHEPPQAAAPVGTKAQ